MIAKTCKIFAEHYEILLQDITAAVTNRKRPAVKRCYYVLDTIMELFSEIFSISVKESHKVLYDIAFPGKEGNSSTAKLSESNIDHLFCKFYRVERDRIGDDRENTSIKAASAACEIVTMFAELRSLSYDEAAKRLNGKREGVKV